VNQTQPRWLPTAGIIASLWRERWLMGRIQNSEVLKRVSATNAATAADFFNRAEVGTSPGEDTLGDAETVKA
jgi:hypothetical protein